MKKEFINKLKKIIEGKVVFLATSDKKGNPNIIAAEVNHLSEKGEIIITNNQMITTVKNISATGKACLLITDNKTFWWRIKTNAKQDRKGKWFKFVKNMETNKNHNPKGALVLKIKEVYDLDKGKTL